MANVRGIEAIVAAVLLIIIAVVGAALLYMWFSGYLTKSTSRAEEFRYSDMVKIDSVEYSNVSTQPMNVTVRNVGDVKIVIDSVYVLDKFDNVVCNAINLDIPLQAGEARVAQVSNCSLGAQLKYGEMYVVKVVTERGVEAATSFRTPPK